MQTQKVVQGMAFVSDEEKTLWKKEEEKKKKKKILVTSFFFLFPQCFHKPLSVRFLLNGYARCPEFKYS